MCQSSTTRYNLTIMKSVIVLGNWKANKTVAEAKSWIDAFAVHKDAIPAGVRVILCPSLHHIPLFMEAKLPFGLGIQDVSPFEAGSYTGAVAASQLQGSGVVVSLIGHSERRTHFGETNEVVAQKVKQCLQGNITPVVCISELPQADVLGQLAPEFFQKGMFLYEPLFAVGSGTPDTPINANAFAAKLAETYGPTPVLYGGSVTPENVASFTSQEHLSGVAVGKNSLDPEIFFQLITHSSPTS